MTIGDILAQQARQRPDAAALIDARSSPPRRLTFRELDDEVARAAAWLEARGVRHGDGVLVFVPMSVDLYVALLALFRLGAVAQFLDPSAGRNHIAHCCARWQPAALIAIPKAHLLRLSTSALRAIPRKFVVGGWAPGADRWLANRAMQGTPSTAASRRAATPADPALITFTSGSTGMPKAAVRTHEFLVVQHRVLARNIALEAGEIDLATLPIFTLANLASGVTTVIPGVDLAQPGAVDGARVLADIDAYAVTRIAGSPAFFERMVGAARDARRTLPALRKLYTGGAPVFPRLLDQLHSCAPAAQVVAVYGSTEAEPIAHLDHAEITEADHAAMRAGRGLLAGRPVAEIQLRVLRVRWGQPRGALNASEFAAENAAVGQPGEIVVTGDHVLRGYLGGVGNEETKFSVDGTVWHRTGDAGWLDEHGRLWLLGRCAARIVDARGELYPFAVECVAMTRPEIKRVAALAVAGRRVLFFEGAAQALPNLRAILPPEQIDEVRWIERMPLDARHNAKIDYPALRRLAGAAD